MLTTDPIIDIAPFLEGTPDRKRAVAAQVARACTDLGFSKFLEAVGAA